MLLSHVGFRRLCQARDMLEDGDRPPPTIDTLARMVGISPAHFIRQFAALFGVTPHQYRLRARLDRAKRLLATGERSVTAVCMDVGFSSLGSFSSLFARRVGESPSDFQRRIDPQSLSPGCLSLMGTMDERNFREAGSGTIGETPEHPKRQETACASS